MSFSTDIEAIYSQRDHCILPYIGEAYTAPAPDDLRIMTVGINTYVSERHWPVRIHAFRDAFAQERHRFDRGVFKEASRLGRGLTIDPAVFGARQFRDRASFFHTNAITTYLKESEGKRAYQVSPEMLADHARQWRAQLLLMDQHHVLPHIIVVFGRPFWSHAWSAFREWSKSAEGLRVSRFIPADGSARHFANRVELASAGHVLLLVRLRHPAGRSKIGDADWLLAQPGFRALADSSIAPPMIEYPPEEVALQHPIGTDFEYRGRTFVRRADGIHLVLPPPPDLPRDAPLRPR